MTSKNLDELLIDLLASYPNAKGVNFHSMEVPVTHHVGSHSELLEQYKDIPMMSLDEDFQTTFSFIITDQGSIIIFFIGNMHFISIYVDNREPNKQLATRMYETYCNQFEEAIKELV